VINYFEARIHFGRKIIALLSKSITKYITGESVQNPITELNEKIRGSWFEGNKSPPMLRVTLNFIKLQTESNYLLCRCLQTTQQVTIINNISTKAQGIRTQKIYV
jgi:hypothetical protein